MPFQPKLAGVRIWLSGSIPDGVEEAEANKIRAFVGALAEAVLREGGTLVHGSQRTLREILLEVATKRKQALGKREGIILAVSHWFLNHTEDHGIDLPMWKEVCEDVWEIPEAPADPHGEDGRTRSLSLLRDAMAGRCDLIVVVGGRWWELAPHRAGVPGELNLAIERGLPIFPVQAFGGAIKGLLEEHSYLFKSCHNGLSKEDNIKLASIEDPGELAAAIVRQASYLPFRRRPRKAGRSFRVLCLDGGGIKGAYTAAVMAYWENATKRSIAEHFDLIAGTSTGGILAIGLGLGLTAGDILQFYRDEGSEIFPADNELVRLRHRFGHWLDSKFDQTVLKEKLEAAYEDKKSINDSICRLFIPCYDARSDSLYPLRTHHPPFDLQPTETDPVIVALATAAAPTYFDPVKAQGTVDDILSLDGGVWANSPGSAALAEVVGKLRVPMDQVEMLSVGTTFSNELQGTPQLAESVVVKGLNFFQGLFTGQLHEGNGKLGWAANIALLLMKTQAQTADYLCENLLGDRYLRVDAVSSAEDLDDVNAISELIGLGDKSGEASLEDVKERFLNGVKADPWR